MMKDFDMLTQQEVYQIFGDEYYQTDIQLVQEN